MQTRDSNKRSEQGEENRDQELENIVGNLLIAEYQVDKLRTRLADHGYRAQMKSNQNKASTHIFKHNNKWYKISLRIDEETNADSAKQREQNQFTGYSSQ
jgi:hypothetical protein